MTQHPRPIPADPLGMGELPRLEVVAATILERDTRDLERALARIPVDQLPRALGQALARHFGRDMARRIADIAVVHAWEA